MLSNKEIMTHPNLKAFKQHGVEFDHVSGTNQAVGVCIFCGSLSSKVEGGVKPSFHVNVETKKWDCKICGESGGYQMFLQAVVKWADEMASARVLRKLGDDRGIRVSTLRAHEVGFNPVNGCYILPIWDAERSTLLDVRFYKIGSQIRSTAGSKVGLYGAHSANIASPNDISVIWLVEGEWDRMVMWEILRRLKIKNEIAVAVPGAQTFKNEWCPLFHNRVVNVVFDNDYERELKGKTVQGAGVLGAIKLYGMLKGSAAMMNFVHWPGRFENGFDLRDLYNAKNNSPRRTYKIVSNYLEDLPKDIEKSDAGKVLIKQENTYDGEGCDIEEVYDVFNKWMMLKNTDVIDVTYATVLANRMTGSPVWLFLVGSSGCGKSEIIMSLKEYKYIEAISSLTANTLISGANFSRENDPSLIPHLDGRILAIKDFTTILGLDSSSQIKIISDLRDAFDGECAKPFGNGRWVKYESRFGIISGVTGIIDIASENLTALGERFVRFIIPIDKSLKGERAVQRRILQNQERGGRDVMQKELKDIGGKFLNYDFGNPAQIPPNMEDRLFALVQWMGIMRGAVMRDFRTTEISHKPMREYCTRLTEQFLNLSRGLAMVHKRKKFTKKEYDVVKYTAKGTAPSREEEIVRKLYLDNVNGHYSVNEISEMIRLPRITTQKVVDNLTALEALKKIKLKKMDSNGNKVYWKLHNKILGLIEEAEIY